MVLMLLMMEMSRGGRGNSCRLPLAGGRGIPAPALISHEPLPLLLLLLPRVGKRRRGVLVLLKKSLLTNFQNSKYRFKIGNKLNIN
jgi:hypothetical protein